MKIFLLYFFIYLFIGAFTYFILTFLFKEKKNNRYVYDFNIIVFTMFIFMWLPLLITLIYGYLSEAIKRLISKGKENDES